MARLFAVMYMICSMYVFNPELCESAAGQNIALDLVSRSFAQSGELKQEIPVLQLLEQKTDYMEVLKQLGYYRQDGSDEDLNRRNAVLRFQSNHNLPVSGEWDETSQTALYMRLLEAVFKYPDIISAPVPESMWIVINKTNRSLTLYENQTVLNKYPVAVGNPPSLTPSGKFTIHSKVMNPVWGGGGYAKPVAGGSPDNPLGYRWLGLSLKGGSRYGIHGNNKPYSIGQNISHGCVRMINSDVEELFDIIPVAIEVWIGTNEELLEWGVEQRPYLPE